jgi:Sulfotransferase domain
VSQPVAFCIGLNRTGTTTFGDACEVLGFTRLGWSRLAGPLSSHQLMKAWDRGDIAQLVKVASCYEVLEDLPWPLVYRQMAETFPTAKFALTRRSSVDQWLESQTKHTSESTYGMHAKIYGSDSAARDPDRYRQRYQRHLAEVREFFAGADRLVELCWEDGDGWDELCGFLGVRTPDVPFPHANVAGSNPPPPRAPWAKRKIRKLRRSARGVRGQLVSELRPTPKPEP